MKASTLLHYASENFAKKCFLKLVKRTLLCYKDLKLSIKLFTGRTLRGLLIQMQNISLRSSGMRRKQNLEFWGLKVTQQS